MNIPEKIDLLINQWKLGSGGIPPKSIYITKNQFSGIGGLYVSPNGNENSTYKGINLIISDFDSFLISVGDGFGQFLSSRVDHSGSGTP